MRKLIAISTALGMLALAACNGAGEPISIGGKSNAGTQALKEAVLENSYVCPQQSNVTNVLYQAPGVGGIGVFLTHFQFGDLRYEVKEVELSNADKMNGITVAGRIVFDENSTYRVRTARERRNGQFEPWGRWRDWEQIKNSNPDDNIGHYIVERDGQFDYYTRGDFFFGKLHVLEDALSKRGLVGVEFDRCS